MTNLKPCPFCGAELEITKSNMGVHPEQSNGSCMLSAMGILADSSRHVEAWNERSTKAAFIESADWIDSNMQEANKLISAIEVKPDTIVRHWYSQILRSFAKEQ